jgi:large subunit ribosomal protein L29
MPILRTKEIREMTTENRQKRLDEMQTELMRLKTMVKAGGAIENPSRVRELRKTIARILTIDTEPTPVKKEEKKEKEKPKSKKKPEKKPEKKQSRKKRKRNPKKPARTKKNESSHSTSKRTNRTQSQSCQEHKPRRRRHFRKNSRRDTQYTHNKTR